MTLPASKYLANTSADYLRGQPPAILASLSRKRTSPAASTAEMGSKSRLSGRTRWRSESRRAGLESVPDLEDAGPGAYDIELGVDERNLDRR